MAFATGGAAVDGGKVSATEWYTSVKKRMYGTAGERRHISLVGTQVQVSRLSTPNHCLGNMGTDTLVISNRLLLRRRTKKDACTSDLTHGPDSTLCNSCDHELQAGDSTEHTYTHDTKAHNAMRK